MSFRVVAVSHTTQRRQPAGSLLPCGHECVCLGACLTPSLCVPQVLLCFSRDTTVLDHFKYNSATPPKSYIQGETMCPFTKHTHTQTHPPAQELTRMPLQLHDHTCGCAAGLGY